MFGLGIQELVLILVILLLLFGSKKLPELSKSLGEAIKNFKKGVSDETKTDSDKKEEEKKPTTI